MLNLKKTAVAVLAFSSSAVFAGTMGPVCAPGPVTVPCESTAWDFGARALYLQPIYDANFAYRNLGNYAVNSVTSEKTWNSNNPKWGWGFMVEGSYHFSTGNDVNVNWYHFNRTTDSDFVGDNVFSNTTLTGSLHDLSFKPQWDAVNFEFGQHVDFGEFKKIRFHGGAQFVRLKTTSSEDVTRSTGVAYSNNNQDHTFNGFGPRTGMDMAYHWGNGFAMYANAAAAILVGTSKFSDEKAISGALSSDSASKTALVPELEAKLGLKYDYALASGDLTLDVGYMWVNYFQAQDGIDRFNDRALTSNLGFDGLYFGAKWTGNVA